MVLIQPEHAKAQYRRALGLLNLDHVTAALAACKQGLSACPDEKCLLDLEVRIAIATRAASLKTRPGKAEGETSAGEAPNLRGLKSDAGITADDRSSVEQVAMMNKMLEMAKLTGKSVPGFESALDTRIPPFHTEFSKGGFFPQGCDAKKAARLLWSAYEHTRCGLGGEARLGIGVVGSNLAMRDPTKDAMPEVRTTQQQLNLLTWSDSPTL